MASGDLQELIVRIKADTAALESGLKDATAATKKATSEMGGSLDGLKEQFAELVPAISLAVLAEFTAHSLEAGVELAHLSDKTGINIETLSALDVVVRQNGASIEELANGVKFMNRNISEAANGNTAMAQSFAAVHLNAEALNKLDTTQQLLTVLDAISKLEKQSDRTNAGMKLMGRGFQDLGALANEGAEGIQAAIDQAKSMGLIINQDQANKMKLFNAEWQIFVVWCERLAQTNITGVISAIGQLIGYFSQNTDPKGFGSLLEIQGQIAKLADGRDEIQRRLDLLNQGGSLTERLFGDPAKDKATLEGALKSNLDQSKALLDRYNVISNARGVVGDKPGGTHLANSAQADANKQIDDYIQKQKDANVVAGEARSQQEGLADYYKIVNDLMDKGLTLQEAEIKIGPDRKEQIIELGNAHAELVRQMHEAQRAADEMKRSFADALTNLAFNFKSAGQAAGDFLKTIAQSIFNKSIATPLSDSLVSALSSQGNGLFSSIGKILGISGARAAGGPVSGGSSYLVGEHGPEIFTPGMSGGITPNNRIGGGSSVQVTQVFNMQPGLAETVGAAIRTAAPQIAAAAQASVFMAMQNGGTESRIAGLRS